MSTIRGFVIALIMVLTPFAGLLFLWNSEEYGPTLQDPSAFIGCYQSARNKVILSKETIYLPRTNQNTLVLRFLYLKNKAAIITVSNLEYDIGGYNLRIGTSNTGFFYRFDNPSKPSALLIPDNSGVVRKLMRVAC
jgi:hypothetical protein